MPMRILSRELPFPEKQEPFLAICIHIIFFGVMYLACFFLKVGVKFPNSVSLLNWDAMWYYRIKEVGYYYTEGQTGPLAFFPLFPYFWKVTFLEQFGISALNFIIFCSSFYAIARYLSLNLLQSLLFLSTPSSFFFWLPYSESLFFLASILILLGFDKNKKDYLIIGILIAGLTRSVNVTFIPALIFTYVASFGYKRSWLKPLTTQVLIIVAAILTVFYIQYNNTGQWFAFFKMQKLWNRSLQMPTLPLTTLSGVRIMWLDGMALYICVLALSDTIKAAIYAFIWNKKAHWPPSMLFSMAYLSIVGLLSVFYSGIWPGQHGTSIMSINRYVFATPYFVYYSYHKVKQLAIKRTWIEPILLLLGVFLCLGAYKTLNGHSNYGQTFLYFSLIALYLISYIYLQTNKKVAIILYFINTSVQIIIFNSFLSHYWIG
jgi:hypothetical protein